MSDDGPGGKGVEAELDLASGKLLKRERRFSSAETFAKALTREQKIEAAFVNEVWTRSENKCGSCGSDDSPRLRLVLIVPEAAGGKRVASNASIICRACELASGGLHRSPPVSWDGSKPRLVSFFLSRDLFTRVGDLLSAKKSFESKGALLRFMMAKFVANSDQYADLEMYQDSQEDRVKESIWVAHDAYEAFKEAVGARGLTVTSALIALAMVFCEEALGQIEQRESRR